MKILNLENENRKFTKSIENFHVMEYLQDSSVSPMTAMEEYYMSKMNVRRRQVVIELDKEHSAIIQSGAMQWMGGHVPVSYTHLVAVIFSRVFSKGFFIGT